MLFFLPALSVKGQSFILPNAYAHNDYWHKRPLLDALDNGFTYVEADIFLRKERLIVAHILPCLQKKRTLEDLYLKPLLDRVNRSNDTTNDLSGSNTPITLMIDIKSEANKTYLALAELLEKYKSILSSYENGVLTLRNVTVVLTGHKPYDLVGCNGNRRVFMDEDLREAGKDSSLNIYPIASCKYSSIMKWKGKGLIGVNEIKKLEYFVAQAHKNGRKVRLWGSPENKVVWAELLKYNVDLINTNKLKALRKFLVSDMQWIAKKNTSTETDL